MDYDLNHFFELSVDLFSIAGPDGYFKRVNPAFEKTLGWTNEELLGQPFLNFIHPEDVDTTNHEIEKLLSGIPTISFENRCRCNDGSYKYLSWTGYPDPKTKNLFAVARDITEKRKTEEIFRLAIEASPSGVIMVDRKGEIMLVNSQSEKYFGYTSQELLGQSVDKLVPVATDIKHSILRSNFLKNPISRPMGAGRDLYALRKNGKKFPVEIGLNPIETQEGLLILVVIVDITERKKIEESLRLAKLEAEKANHLKSEFLNLMSHELRTPLTVMLGNLPLLTDEYQLPENKEIAEIAQDIEESGKHLLTLINDLLDISKIEAGQLQLHQESLFVGDLLENVASNIKTLADKKGLSIKLDVEECEINADLVRMKQILLNLLSNAVKFTDKGGIVIKARKKKDKAFIEVQDTGNGIRKKDIPLLFNKFKQLDESSTRKATGTGLGLVITKRLVELHGGEISVTSGLNKGSSFKFSIPCN